MASFPRLLRHDDTASCDTGSVCCGYLFTLLAPVLRCEQELSGVVFQSHNQSFSLCEWRKILFVYTTLEVDKTLLLRGEHYKLTRQARTCARDVTCKCASGVQRRFTELPQCFVKSCESVHSDCTRDFSQGPYRSCALVFHIADDSTFTLQNCCMSQLADVLQADA